MQSTIIIVPNFEKLNELKTSLNNFHQEKLFIDKKSENNRLIFPVLDGFEVVPFDELIYCESGNSSTTFYLNNQKCKRKVMSKGIGKVLKMLPEEKFFRIHNKFIINQDYISRFSNRKSEVHLNTLIHPLPVSRNQKPKFLHWLGVSNNP